jgi:D-tyrosyl-tRNA(Tyr) deacylase
MRVLIQRVSCAAVSVEGETVGEIGPGLLAFIGIRESDTEVEVRWMAEKVAQLRVFEDSEGRMNLSVEETGGSVLAVSQFTLYGDLPKGNRPSFMMAARPEVARPLYEVFLRLLSERLGTERVASGVFQAKMQVELSNDGPVTLMLQRDSIPS